MDPLSTFIPPPEPQGPAPIMPPGPGLPEGGQPPPISGLATSALILAVLGSICLGPVGSVAGVILGAIALWEIRQSQGQKGGGVLAAIAVGVGSLVTIAFGVAVVAMFTAGMRSASAPSPPPTPYVPPVVPSTAPTTKPVPRPTPPSEVGMSKDMGTVETRVGLLTVVDVGPDVANLVAELRLQRGKASRDGQKLMLQTTQLECRPCLGVAASLSDPRMQRALKAVRLVRVDVGDFAEELTALGIPTKVIPGFYFLNADQLPTDGVHGGEWDDDTAANIAPVLGAFVRGTYTNRREPFRPGRAAKPNGTVL